jgi:hypothetical protein
MKKVVEDMWRVAPGKYPEMTPTAMTKRVEVQIVLTFCGRKLWTGYGRAAWLAAREYAARQNEAGAVPGFMPGKCLADYPSAAARTARMLKDCDGKGVRPTRR